MESNFGKILRDLRMERKLSQAEFGKIMNLAPNTISSWERGNSCPSIDELKIIATYFNVAAGFLLGLED